MARTRRRWRRTFAVALLGTVLGITLAPAMVASQEAPVAPPPEVDGPVPTAAGLRGGPITSVRRPLAEHGYVEQEFFLAGTANAYEAAGLWGEDGRWGTTVRASSPYATRLLVRRPIDPSRFNGTVIVSWLNVDGGFENDVEWVQAGDELMREGAAYVGVSAQSLGVSGLLGAVVWDTTRYARLGLTDDALSYDVFTHAGAVLKDPGEVDPLEGLPAERRLIATGQSQSAQRLVTYMNAFHPSADVYDGFLLLSRFAGAAPLGAAPMTYPDPDAPSRPDPLTALLAGPPRAQLRDDLDVPVFVLLTETEASQNDAVRRPDSERYRTWEVAGSAHLDTTLLGAQRSLLRREFPLAIVDPMASCASPNAFPTAYAVRAALRAMGAWVADGDAPPSAPRLTRDAAGAIVRDPDGNALGGVRLPEIEVPTASHSGESSVDGMCSLVGSTVPFDAAELAARYPHPQAYIDAVAEASASAVEAGHMVPEDVAVAAATATRSVGGTASPAGAAAPESGAATPGAAGPDAVATPDRGAAAAAPDAPDRAEAKRSDPGWMATTGRDLITPVLIGFLLLLNGRVVLTIANQRRSGR
ncbi:MAG: alpha/beta hydrolase domain-containing protein [Acidimicrobiales bacterium]|nr:alpha/beta hydrolase domain-containing protein [Acidimicrobiales bacterium]